VNTTMPRQSETPFSSEQVFQNRWGLQASISFSPFPSLDCSHFFVLGPIFTQPKSEKCFKPAEKPTETVATCTLGNQRIQNPQPLALS